LIGSESLNQLFANSFLKLIYISQEGIEISLVLFTDDDLSPLSLTHADQIESLLALFDRYDRYSGSTSMNGSQLYSVSTFLQNSLSNLFNNLSNNLSNNLGLELGTGMNITLRETLHKIDLKAVKQRILATTLPMVCHDTIVQPRPHGPIQGNYFLFPEQKTVNAETLPKR
jgi:hypothetical protein